MEDETDGERGEEDKVGILITYPTLFISCYFSNKKMFKTRKIIP